MLSYQYIYIRNFLYLSRCGKKYENESFTSYFGASVLADEEVVMIAQCAGSLTTAIRNLIRVSSQ